MGGWQREEKETFYILPLIVIPCLQLDQYHFCWRWRLLLVSMAMWLLEACRLHESPIYQSSRL